MGWHLPSGGFGSVSDPLDGFLRDRVEEIQEVDVGVADKIERFPHGMVVGSCSHSSATFLSRFLVNIIDEELDDDSVVVRGPCRAVDNCAASV